MKKRIPPIALSLILAAVTAFSSYAYLLGDVNIDGKVTAVDARAILRVSAKLSTFDNEEQMKRADVDGNGKITAGDARKALRMSAHLEDFIEVGEETSSEENTTKQPTTEESTTEEPVTEEPSTEEKTTEETTKSEKTDEEKEKEQIEAFLSSRYRLKGSITDSNANNAIDYALNGKDLVLETEMSGKPVTVLIKSTTSKILGKEKTTAKLYMRGISSGGKKIYFEVSETIAKAAGIDLSELTESVSSIGGVTSMTYDSVETEAASNGKIHRVYKYVSSVDKSYALFKASDGNLKRIEVYDAYGNCQEIVYISDFIYGGNLPDSYFSVDGYEKEGIISFFSDLGIDTE